MIHGGVGQWNLSFGGSPGSDSPIPNNIELSLLGKPMVCILLVGAAVLCTLWKQRSLPQTGQNKWTYDLVWAKWMLYARPWNSEGDVSDKRYMEVKVMTVAVTESLMDSSCCEMLAMYVSSFLTF